MITTVDERTNPKLAEVVRRLAEKFQPDRIYLFGSQARDEATEDSDFDIMVVVPESDLPSHRRAQQAYSVLWGTGIPVEVLVFTREQFERQSRVVASLAATVAREGRLLYER
jgi:uncharacterized protein